VSEDKKIYRKSLSLFVIVLSLIFCFTDSSGQENPPGSEREPVFSGFDPDAPPETRIRLAPHLTTGGQLELEYVRRQNLVLESDQGQDVATMEPALTLAFSYDPSRRFEGYFAVKWSRTLTYGDRDNENDQVSLEFEEAYVLFKNMMNERISFQIGRQRFDDERQWLYDAELDAARTFLKFSRYLVEISASREGLVDKDLLNDQDEERINNYTVYGTYAISEDTNVAAYVLGRDDRSAENNSPIFYGIHSDGDLSDSLGYWLELAYVTGRDGTNKVRGMGLDIGSTYVFDLPLEPSLTLGRALGTGDGRPNDGVDRTFRQTGLQGNEGDFNGATDFKYYGELFDPELSNLSIFTAGVGINPTDTSSIDLVYHSYRQDRASDSLPDAGIDIHPDGLSKKLGSETDLITGYVYERREISFETALMLAYFIPGKAFPSHSEKSFLTKLVVQFEF
jgi:alginate production protein